jgi:hypothetical protein
MPLSDPYASGSCDPAQWAINSYCPDPLAGLEPIAETPNPYRDYSWSCLRILLAVDAFITSSRDPRLAWYAVVFTLKLGSLPRGMSGAELAKAIGVAPAAVSRSVSRFREMAGLDSPEEARAFGLTRSDGRHDPLA